jgi:anti-sigma B factor antagonist
LLKYIRLTLLSFKKVVYGDTINTKIQISDDKMNVEVSGRLDIESSYGLERELMENISGITELILDFKGLEYISSSGLRVILTIQRMMKDQGKLIVKNVNEFVMEVLKTTNIDKLLDIQ